MSDEERDREIADAKFFGITVEQLRRQRQELGQLTDGPYAGCSPSFAAMMEESKKVSVLLNKLKIKEKQP